MSNLVEIGINLSSYLASLSPQIKKGSLQWYFSGSLATMTVIGAESITEIELDERNNVIGEKQEKVITDEQRERLKTFSRKLGEDIDIVNVHASLFSGAPAGNKPHIQNIKDNVPDVLELMSWPETLGGTMYIDNLETEREITNHPVARVKTRNGDVYVTAPPEQLAHKLSETLTLREMLNGKLSNNEDVLSHYQKDIRDLSSMYYGFKELYGKEEFFDRIYTALSQKDGSEFNRENSNLEAIMKQIAEDSSAYLKKISDDKSNEEIEDFLFRLAQIKMEENSKNDVKSKREEFEANLQQGVPKDIEARAKEQVNKTEPTLRGVEELGKE